MRLAGNMRTKTRDQFPLEIFVFGESIPFLMGSGCFSLAVYADLTVTF